MNRRKRAAAKRGVRGPKGSRPAAQRRVRGQPSGRPQDHFGERAKKHGFPSRAVFKLEEIDRRLRLLRPGMRVLDLGAAPGSFSLYAASRVGAQGRVVGIDQQEIRVGAPPQLTFLQLDMLEADLQTLGEPHGFDVVLSDMAPWTSGMRHRDQFLSYELFMRALVASDALLAPSGAFVGKIFQGAEFEDARRALAARFERVRVIKPEASRDESYEVFLCGLHKRA